MLFRLSDSALIKTARSRLRLSARWRTEKPSISVKIIFTTINRFQTHAHSNFHNVRVILQISSTFYPPFNFVSLSYGKVSKQRSDVIGSSQEL